MPASASPAEIGSDHNSHGHATNTWECADNDLGCVVLQEQEHGNFNVNVVPSAGRLTAFSVRGASGLYSLRVYSGSNGDLVDESGVASGDGTDTVVTHPLTPSIPVQAGDFIGLALSDSSRVGIRAPVAEAGTTLLEFPLAGGLAQDNGPYELFLSATFQPNVVSTPVVPPVLPKPIPVPDPLAALRAGKRPTATLAGGTLKISKRGGGAITLTNPNGYTLKGTLSLASGKLKLGKARVSLAPRATKAFKFKLSRKALRRLRKKRKLRAIATAKLKGPIGKTGTIKKRVTLKAPPKPKPKRKKRRSGGGGGGQGPASNLWVARNGNSGAFDDFKFRLNGGTINLTGTSLLFVSCFEIGGSYRSSFSYEIFNLLGPWALGNQNTTQKQQSRAVNVLVGSGERTITYTLTSRRSGNKITGQRKMSFSSSSYNPFDNTISSTFCSGTQNYEAIPG